MKKILWSVFVVLIAPVFCFAFAPSPTQVVHQNDGPAFVKISPELVETIFADETFLNGVELLTITPDGNRLWSAMGRLSEPLTGEIKTEAKAFVLKHSELFNLPEGKGDEILRTVKSENAANAHHVSFQMNMDGIDVHHAVIELHISDRTKVVQLINGSFPDIRSITNRITLGNSDAVKAAGALLNITELRGVSKAKLEIWPTKEGTGLMAYVVRIPAQKPLGDWEIILDADTGKELYRNNEMAFRATQTGRGSIYPNHPLAGNAKLEKLVNLTSFSLEGLYAKVTNDDGPSASNSNYEHIYDPKTSINFDEVNAYYHVDKVHAFFQSMGFKDLDLPFKTIVRYGTDYDNAFFSPWQGLIAFGSGTKLNNLAHEESVIYHEYSHAVLSNIIRLVYNDESGAIDEGQADYFACSLSNNHLVGEWAVAKMGKPFLRDLTNDLIYPDDISGEVHADGRIWGGVLWDLRKSLGASISDPLIHNSFKYLKSNTPKFLDAYKAIAVADENLFDGKNKAKIFEVMKNRGISASSYKGTALDKSDIMKLKNFRHNHNE